MIQVIQRAFDILEFVSSKRNEPVQLSKIAEQAGLSQPTTANIVKALVHKNYLEQVGRKVGYRLGIAAYQLTSNPTYDQDLVQAAKGPLKELTQQLQETSLLAVVRNNKRVIIHIEECDQALQVKTLPIADIYPTSTGRILLAYMSTKELEKIVSALGFPSKKLWPGAQNWETLQAKLAQIRADESVEVKSVLHTVAFGVPVFRNKEVVAGLGLYIPESRYTETNKSKMFKLIQKAAKKISEQL